MLLVVDHEMVNQIDLRNLLPTDQRLKYALFPRMRAILSTIAYMSIYIMKTTSFAWLQIKKNVTKALSVR